MKRIVELLISAANSQKWNDLIRPSNVCSKEISHHGAKMFIAHILSEFNDECGGQSVDYPKLIEGSIFELIEDIVLTDLKPEIRDEFMKRKGPELKSFILAQNYLVDEDPNSPINQMNARFKEYLFDDNYASKEKEILHAADIIVSKWQFDILYPFNKEMYNIEEYKSRIEKRLKKIIHLPYAKKLLDIKYYDFVRMIGQAGVQKRWSRYPIAPEISVLGHEFMVAIMSYVSSLIMRYCKEGLRNNFVNGLFHDFPEIFTKDISSQVKRYIDGIDEIIRKIEIKFVKEKTAFLPTMIRQEINELVKREFTCRVFIKSLGRYKKVDEKSILNKYNKDEFYPVDGQLTKQWDLFFAYLESAISVANGTTHPYVVDQYHNQYNDNRNSIPEVIDSAIGLSQLYDYYYECRNISTK